MVVVSSGAFGVFAAATADGYVAEGAAVGPVTAAGLAEVTWLRVVVVVVVTELGVGGVAAWAWEVLLFWWRRRSSSSSRRVLKGLGCAAGIHRGHLVWWLSKMCVRERERE